MQQEQEEKGPKMQLDKRDQGIALGLVVSQLRRSRGRIRIDGSARGGWALLAAGWAKCSAVAFNLITRRRVVAYAISGHG